MIRNVFGKRVTESTMRSLPEYRNEPTISRKDMARAALLLKNSQERDERVITHVKKLREQNARTNTASTLGWIYNATGSAIELFNSCNWNGCVTSNPYPVRIENGQWGMFLHEETNSSGSSAAVVYEVVDRYETHRWCVAWETSADWSVENKVYAELQGVHYGEVGNNLHDSLKKSGSVHKVKQGEFLSIMSVSGGPDAIFEALLTFEGL